MKKLSQETKDIVTIFGLVLIGICFTFVFGIIILHYNISNDEDVYNWTTLAIEIGIGIGITFTVWKFSKRDQSKIRELVDETKKMEQMQLDVEKKLLGIIEQQEKFRNEQYDFAINRTKSYLGSLHSTIDMLMKLDIDPNIPENKEMNFWLDFKNQMVAQLDHIVNQSGAILEQHYLQLLTDIIELARTNPKPTTTDEGFFILDASYCQGILSQIDDILKIMPSPPI